MLFINLMYINIRNSKMYIFCFQVTSFLPPYQIVSSVSLGSREWLRSKLLNALTRVSLGGLETDIISRRRAMSSHVSVPRDTNGNGSALQTQV